MSLCERCRTELVNSRQPLTQRQREILDWIGCYITLNAFAPTAREIAEAFAFRSLATVMEHLDGLQQKGWITRVPNTTRNIELVEAPAQVTP